MVGGPPVGPAAPVPDPDMVLLLRRLSHEIRNPLASLKAGVQLLQRLTKPEGEIAEYFGSLLTQIGRIDRIVDGVHAYARLDGGDPRPVVVTEAVEAAVQSAQEAATRAGVALQLEAGPRAVVIVDPGCLHTALVELTANAIQASPPGGTVILSWEELPGPVVGVSVDDEGSGVSAENADKIIRPFFTTQPQARGLGLAVASRICALSGGRLEWANRPQGGCRFSLLFPARAS